MTLTLETGLPCGPERSLRLRFVHNERLRKIVAQRRRMELFDEHYEDVLLDPTDFLEERRRFYLRLKLSGKGIDGSARVSRCAQIGAAIKAHGGVFWYTRTSSTVSAFPLEPNPSVASVTRVMLDPHFPQHEEFPATWLGRLLYLAALTDGRRRWKVRYGALVVKYDLLYSQMLLEEMGCEMISTAFPLLSRDLSVQEPIPVVAMVADFESTATREALRRSWSKLKGESVEIEPSLLASLGLKRFPEWESATPWTSRQPKLSKAFAYFKANAAIPAFAVAG